MIKTIKPEKKSDKELYKILMEKISTGNYVFSRHAKQRLKDRTILDIDVINILEGKKGYKKTRNKSKDKYKHGRQDWSYCIEGCDLDRSKIRIIISFEEALIIIITVIRLE